MKKDEYISAVVGGIKRRRDRLFVQKELEAHIADRMEFYTEAGFDEAEAETKALERLGKPEAVATDMANLHNSALYTVLSYVFTFAYVAAALFSVLLLVFAFYELIDEFNYTYAVMMCSLIAFLFDTLGLVFARLAEDSGAMETNGVVNLVSLFLVGGIVFIPFGYAILSLFTEFPLSLFSTEGVTVSFIEMYTLLPEPLEYVMILLTYSFGLFPLIQGILARRFAKKIEFGLSEKSEKRLKHYIVFLLTLTVIGAVSITVQAGVPLLQQHQLDNRNESTFTEDCAAAWELTETLTPPYTKEEALVLAKQRGTDKLKSITREVTVLSNNNYTVTLETLDGETYDTLTLEKRTKLNNLTEKELLQYSNLDDDTTLDAFLDEIGKDTITLYSFDKKSVTVDICDNTNTLWYTFSFVDGVIDEITEL